MLDRELSRRIFMTEICFAGAALMLPAFTLSALGQQTDAKPLKALFFTKSQGFEHSVVKRPDNNSDAKLSHAEGILVDLGKKNGFDVTATKDGGYFTEEKLAAFDLFVFYTTGELNRPGGDKTPPMPADGQDVLLKAVRGGKGFVGIHCACDTFHTPKDGPEKDVVQPYIKALGAEFRRHGGQQKSKVTAVVKDFGGKKLTDFELTEEWYQFQHESTDRDVLLMQETKSMKEKEYTESDPYPNTWTRKEGAGRVFYTSLGHREDVWTNEVFQNILLAGIMWASKRA